MSIEHDGPRAPSEPLRTLETLRAAGSVDDVVARLERAIAAVGAKLFARFDHAAEARAVGLVMRPTVVIVFGNPVAGTPLMVAHPTAALDLPLKALVWEDEAGATWLTFHTRALLEAQHGVEASVTARFAPVEQLLEKVAAG